jgi:hypothetical protein
MMQTQEITFAELRNAYTQVREFVKENTGCEDKEIGLYSTMENHLGVDSEDMFINFVDKFGIKNEIEKQSVLTEWLFKMLGWLLIIGFVYVIITEFFLIIGICLIISLLIGITAIIDKFLPKRKIYIISKKDWQQDKLTVADLVSTLIAKEYVPKKEVNYVLKK